MEQNDREFDAQPDDLSGEVDQQENASEAEQGKEQPQYVSMDEFIKFKKETQGLVDKSASRLEKRISEAVGRADLAIEAAKDAGKAFTPEEEEAYRTRQINKVLTTKEAAQVQAASTPGQGQAQPGQPNVHPAVLLAGDMFKRAGFEVEKDDPEFSIIDLKTQEPLTYLDSIKRSIEAKQKRLNKEPSQAAAPASNGSGNSPPKPTADNYRREMKAAVGKPEKVREVKERYRKQGLDVDHTPLYPGS